MEFNLSIIFPAEEVIVAFDECKFDSAMYSLRIMVGIREIYIRVVSL